MMNTKNVTMLMMVMMVVMGTENILVHANRHLCDFPGRCGRDPSPSPSQYSLSSDLRHHHTPKSPSSSPSSNDFILDITPNFVSISSDFHHHTPKSPSPSPSSRHHHHHHRRRRHHHHHKSPSPPPSSNDFILDIAPNFVSISSDFHHHAPKSPSPSPSPSSEHHHRRRRHRHHKSPSPSPSSDFHHHTPKSPSPSSLQDDSSFDIAFTLAKT